MAFTVDNLLPGFFRGARFLIEDHQITQGRKTATFEYPNHNQRYVEDLGQLKRIIRIRAVLGGDNYLIEREALQLALNLPGPGILLHPWHGIITVAAKPYTITESLTEVGLVRFDLEFEETNLGIFPDSLVTSISIISRVASLLLLGIQDEIADLFTTTSDTSSHETFDSAVEQGDNIAETFEEVEFPAGTDQTIINDYSAQIDSFRADLPRLVVNEDEYGAALVGLFNLSDTLGEDSEAKYEIASTFFGFGENDTEIQQTTADRKQRLENRTAINSAVNVASLSNAYINASRIAYKNEEQLLEVADELEGQYQLITSDTNFSSDTLRQLSTLRYQVRLLFDQFRLNVAKIVQVNVHPIPATVLSYQYYGDLDNTEEIISVNDILNTTRISGDIKLLTEV